MTSLTGSVNNSLVNWSIINNSDDTANASSITQSLSVSNQDRFISVLSEGQFAYHSNVIHDPTDPINDPTSMTPYQRAVTIAMLGEDVISNSIRPHRIRETKECFVDRMRNHLSPPLILNKNSSLEPPTHIRTLDAPGVVDDFYFSLMDISNNQLAVALENKLYLLDLLDTSSTAREIPINFGEIAITSVKWLKNDWIAVATMDNQIYFWNEVTGKGKKFNLTSYVNVIACPDNNSHLVYLGCEKGELLRINLHSNVIRDYHSQAKLTCGLALSPSNRYLIQGTNENKVYVWDLETEKIIMSFKEHTSAVKAMTWINERYFATGGGTVDRKIIIWDLKHKQQVTSVKTEGQITTLCWHKGTLFSTHGYSGNHFATWEIDWDNKKLTNIFKTDMSINGRGGRRILSGVINPSSNSLFCLCANEQVSVWDISKSIKEPTPMKRLSSRSSSCHEIINKTIR